VIFTTAYDEYALKAFRVNSIDYLLKPIDGKAVRRSLDKLASFSSHPTHAGDFEKLLSFFKKTSAYRTHFLVPVKGDKLIPLQADEMACVYIDTGLVKARTFDEKTFTLEDTLDDISGMLDPDCFFRANRQFIVARTAIRDIDFWFNNRLSLNLKVNMPEKVLISKARVPDFRKWFSGRQSMP
jgi:two-component system LytT family response regulator